MNGLMLLHFFPTGAFILGIIALMVCVAISRVPCPKDLRLRAQIVASLVGIAWLAHGAYELHLNGWKQTVVGAPIRVDFFILGPLLYFASGKAYATVKRVTKAARASS